METIGSLAKIPKVEHARQRARESMEKAAAGANPVAEKRAARTREAANTVRAAAQRYLAENRSRGRAQQGRPLRPKTAREWRRIWQHDVLPVWGDRPLAQITKADVIQLVNDKGARRERPRAGATEGAAVQAGKMLTRLRTFFGWAIARDLITHDPTAGVEKPAKEAERDRVLSDDEIRLFWSSCDRLGYPFGPLFKLLLLTAQRDESEVAGMRWSELDLGDRTWTIPGFRTKNGKPHIVHLSELALEILASVPQIEDQDLLFSGTGKTPVSGFSQAKARLDQEMLSALRAENDELADIPAWVLHDLRRTATTGMARLGVAPHIADRVLNHQAGTIRGVARVYNRFEYLAERETALETWGRFVESFVRAVPSNVVTLAAGALSYGRDRRG
jgi:integrase